MKTKDNGETQSKQFNFIGNSSISFSHTFRKSKEGNTHLPFFVIAYGKNGFVIYLLCFSVCVSF